MIPLLLLLVISYALYVGWQRRNTTWLKALLLVLVLGGADLALNIYYGSRKDCGSLYNTDVGCANALPSWLVPFGLAMLLLAVLISLVIIFTSQKHHLQKLTKTIRQHKKAIGLVGLGIVCILALSYAFTCLPVSSVWLPNANVSKTDDDILYNLPVNKHSTLTLYGRADVYTSTNNATKIYVFHANPLLHASLCPNIAWREALGSSACEVQGNFEGSKIYTISRNDASSLTEQYIQIGNTFIYVLANFSSASYIQNFELVPHNKVDQYLTANRSLSNPIVEKKKQAEETAKQKSAVAYTKLPFAPALPQSLPEGWQMLTKITSAPITIDGVDADHPTLVSTDYTGKINGKREDVEFHVGLLSAFTLGDSCGPSPGYSMQKLPCKKVPGTDYYEALLYDERDDLIRYLYRPLGDSLIITQVALINNGGARPTLSPELAKIQNDITASAHPVDVSVLKGSAYSRVYY